MSFHSITNYQSSKHTNQTYCLSLVRFLYSLLHLFDCTCLSSATSFLGLGYRKCVLPSDESIPLLNHFLVDFCEQDKTVNSDITKCKHFEALFHALLFTLIHTPYICN